MKILKLILLVFIAQALLISNGYAQPETTLLLFLCPGHRLAWRGGFRTASDNKPEIFLPQLRNMGVNLTKLYLFWQQIEPTKDHYKWDAVDTFLKQLKSPDEALIAVFSSSMWATKVSSQTLPPSPAKSPDEYYHFIFDLVKHCNGKIKLWQNDCEPSNPIYWSGTNEEFISQLKVFYRAVKDADPQAQVVMGIRWAF